MIITGILFKWNNCLGGDYNSLIIFPILVIVGVVQNATAGTSVSNQNRVA